jgi:hypothetical protein
MTGLLLVAAALLAAMIGSELALRGTKLQTGLGRVLVAWTVVWAAALYPLLHSGAIGPIALTLFWGGAFLSWFGVRSHVESSILLRMLYMLRKQPMTEARVVESYSAHFGHASRIAELLRGGMTTESGGRQTITTKGRAILRIVSKLR